MLSQDTTDDILNKHIDDSTLNYTLTNKYDSTSDSEKISENPTFEKISENIQNNLLRDDSATKHNNVISDETLNFSHEKKIRFIFFICIVKYRIINIKFVWKKNTIYI